MSHHDDRRAKRSPLRRMLSARSRPDKARAHTRQFSRPNHGGISNCGPSHRAGFCSKRRGAADLKPRRLIRASSLELRPGRLVRMTRLVPVAAPRHPRRACSTTTSGSGKFCLATSLLALSHSATTSSRAAPGRRGPRRRLAAALDGALCSSAPGRGKIPPSRPRRF